MRLVAQSCAERYREAIASFRWSNRPVTASFGVATRSPSIEDPASLVEEADRALYHYKCAGRTRVIQPATNGVSAISSEAMSAAVDCGATQIRACGEVPAYYDDSLQLGRFPAP